MRRTELEKLSLLKAKKLMENEEIKTMTDLMSEIMINFDPTLGYSTELLRTDKLFFYYPDLVEHLAEDCKITGALGRAIQGFKLGEWIQKMEENIESFEQVEAPDEFIVFGQWSQEQSPVDLALFKDYPKILGYRSLKPYRDFLLERFARKSTIFIHHLPEKFSDWTTTYVQEKVLNSSESLREKYRLERRISGLQSLGDGEKKDTLDTRLLGGKIPVWKDLYYLKELRKEATLSNVGLKNFRMIKYFGRPPEKVEKETEILVMLAEDLIKGMGYRRVSKKYVEEISRIYRWETSIWLPYLGLPKWRMMLFSPPSIRKKLLEKRLIGSDSIKKYLAAKNVFYYKYPHLVVI
jgi:hypothetical protein